MQPKQVRTPSDAPPRFRLWLATGLLVLVIFLVIGAITYLTGGGRLASLFPVILWGAVTFIIVTLAAAVVMRNGLPRRFPLALTAIYAILIVGGAVGGVLIYRDVLPPRYQNEIRTQMPFMSNFLPPTPVGGVVPTASTSNSGISPESLLSMPLFDSTEEADSSPTGEATLEASWNPTQAAPQISLVSNRVQQDPMPTLAATPRAINRPAAARMYSFTHVQQDWNNCGPANITMALSFFGWRESQDYAAQFLKPNDEDKNVSPSEMVTFVREQTQVSALTRYGGNMEMLKDFIASNVPIIIETGYMPEGYDWIGHYQTVVGYDDAQRVFFVYDSYLGTGEGGAGLTVAYDEFDRLWRHFNRLFIALYEPSRERLVAQILGEHADVSRAAEIAAETAQAEAAANPRDVYAWFNLGTSLTRLGRYEQAAAAYDRAMSLGIPFRMLWYQFGPFEAYFNTGRYDDVMALVNTNLTNTPYVEETYYWQGKVFQARGQIREASTAFNQAISRNSRFQAARDALSEL
jgi:tetratricopeptide (TPR) repeat protein